MKKLLVLLVVLGLLGAGGWFLYGRYLSPERQACGRLAELCGGKDEQRNESSCEEGLEDYKKMVGQQAYDKALACVDEAKSCLGAAGCMTGGGLRGLGQFLEGVFKGLEPDLKKKGQQLLEKLKEKADEL
jgi:hypothetical protein